VPTYKVLHQYVIGPRKVTRAGSGVPTVYLGTKLKHLVGKRVLVVVEVLDEENGVRT
jgi:hypothetical protein